MPDFYMKFPFKELIWEISISSRTLCTCDWALALTIKPSLLRKFMYFFFLTFEKFLLDCHQGYLFVSVGSETHKSRRVDNSSL